MRRSFCLISPAINILEGYDIIHLNGDIHRYVLSTSNFLCDVGEPRYKHNNTENQIERVGNISQVLEVIKLLAVLEVLKVLKILKVLKVLKVLF